MTGLKTLGWVEEGESQKTTGVKIVHFIFIFLFNGCMIMLGGLQVFIPRNAFYMSMTY